MLIWVYHVKDGLGINLNIIEELNLDMIGHSTDKLYINRY